MTREEAIKQLRLLKGDIPFGIASKVENKNQIEALSIAIASLETDEAYQLEYERTTRNDLPHCQYSDEEIAKSFIEDVEAVKDQLPCGEQMDFPSTFDEFAKHYGFKDKDEVYTNGSELIPVFRVKQWLEHISTTKNDLSSGLKNGSPIIDWNNCHTSEQLDSISTTKNDLGVDCISRKAVKTRLKEIINEMETIFADIREREVDDSVCGLCEYDCDHGVDGFANECPGFEKDDCFKLNEKYRAEWLDISNLPSVTPIRPKGHWNEIPKYKDVAWQCSECEHFTTWKHKYCPNCGAKMIEPQESEEV